MRQSQQRKTWKKGKRERGRQRNEDRHASDRARTLFREEQLVKQGRLELTPERVKLLPSLLTIEGLKRK